MKKTAIRRKAACSGAAATALLWALPATALAAEEAAPVGHWWALLPPLIAIALALATKEVYSSLFIGILVGGALWSAHFFEGGFLEGTLTHVVERGIIASLADASHAGILVFLVILGIMVALMNRSGGAAAFGRWAEGRIKTRVGAQLATVALGALIFIDDYFNCLTVGSVMRPVTDRHRISRAKLAFLIDATAAPVCIIAPISSWAAAVSGFVPGEDGFLLFLQAIPYNFYALLMLAMLVALVLMDFDYGPMRREEALARARADLHAAAEQPGAAAGRGGVIDLLLPVAALIVCCTIGMMYTGAREGASGLVELFSKSDASVGLTLGSLCALVIAEAAATLRGTLTFRECMDCAPKGFKAMVPAIFILTFAWALKAMTDSLHAKEFVAMAMQGSAAGLDAFLPAVIFLVALGLAFASGTSWATFGILIPIVVAIFDGRDHTMMVMSISACMAGAVCGDHCSPISDTTIMSSAGGRCDHITHVNTQLPYALTCAAVSCAAYLIAGFVKGWAIPLAAGLALLLAELFAFRWLGGLKSEESAGETAGITSSPAT